MKGLRIVLALVVFLLGSTYGWAEWYPGIIHAHSLFSDGARTPEKLVSRAKDAAGRFLVVTDHYEQIDGLYLPDGKTLKYGVHLWAANRGLSVGVGEAAFNLVTGAGFDCYEFGRYRSRFLGQESADFVIIPGAEITTFWGEGDSRAVSHILAFGKAAFKDDNLFNYFKEENQQAVIDRLNELGALPVAAHPFLVSTTKYRWYVGDIQNLCFNPRQSDNIKGIEFFNEGGPHDYYLTRSWYLSLLKKGNKIFVTAGCDSHADVTGDSDRWTRKTWVFSEKLEAKSLLEAIAQGQTYAAQHGASLEKLNYIPGFQVQEVERPKFLFSVAFDKKISDSKTIQIYRDGKLIEGSVQTHKKENIKGLQKIAYVWEDKYIEAGEHSYVIEVEGVLITSPIRLKLKTQPLVKDWKEYKLGALSFSVPSDWEVYVPKTETFFDAWPPVNRTDKRFIFFMVGILDDPYERPEGSEHKGGIIHYDRSGGKIEDPEAISPGMTITHPRGKIIDSFKREIAGQPVTVCVLHRTGESKNDKGVKYVEYVFYLFAGRKHHLIHLEGVDPNYLSAMFKEISPRIHLSPKVN